jgi:DICT domain-containing protein
MVLMVVRVVDKRLVLLVRVTMVVLFAVLEDQVVAVEPVEPVVIVAIQTEQAVVAEQALLYRAVL